MPTHLTKFELDLAEMAIDQQLHRYNTDTGITGVGVIGVDAAVIQSWSDCALRLP